MEPRFFRTPDHFRRWFEKNHDQKSELVVGFYKVGTGRPSITWPESVDQALCFGWIDGIRRSIDESSYAIRFTPRKPRSIWSAKNVKRMHELIEAGLVQPAGLRAFEHYDEARTNRYSYEQLNTEFDAAALKKFRADQPAWQFFQSQPPSYRRLVASWVMGAKLEATRLRRLDTLIADSAAGLRIRQMRRP